MLHELWYDALDRTVRVVLARNDAPTWYHVCSFINVVLFFLPVSRLSRANMLHLKQ